MKSVLKSIRCQSRYTGYSIQSNRCELKDDALAWTSIAISGLRKSNIASENLVERRRKPFGTRQAPDLIIGKHNGKDNDAGV